MSTEISNFKQQREKLAGICEEHKLVYSIKTGYPITLKIRPNSGMDEQLSMLEAAGDEDRIPQDAYIVFSFTEDGVKTVTDGRFPISETLFNKIKNIFKKMCEFWTRHFFRFMLENDAVDPRLMPELPPDDGAPEPTPVLEDDDLPEPDVDGLSDDFMEG